MPLAMSSRRLSRRRSESTLRPPFAATRRFSRTVSSWKTAGTWNFLATPKRAIVCTGRPSIRCPSSSTRPAVGLRSPVRTLNSVVFPAPFGPMTQRISPLSTRKSTPSTATRPPNRLTTPLASSTGPAPSHNTHEPVLHVANYPEEPVGLDQHNDQEEHAGGQDPVAAEPFGQQRLAVVDDERTQERADQRAPAADGQPHDDPRGEPHAKLGGVNERFKRDIEDAGQPGQCGGQDKHDGSDG